MANQNENELLEIVKSLQAEIAELKKFKKSKEKIGPRPKKTSKTKNVIIEKPINKGKSKKNTFVDDGELCQEDKEFDQKYGSKFKISPRRSPAVMQEVVCSRCRKVYQTYTPQSYWICPKCAKQ